MTCSSEKRHLVLPSLQRRAVHRVSTHVQFETTAECGVLTKLAMRACCVRSACVRLL